MTMVSLVDLCNLTASVEEVLEDLPDTGKAVAEKFRAEGVRGNSISGVSCPVATHLKSQVTIPADVWLHVGLDEVSLESGKFVILTELPRGPKQFVYGITIQAKYRDLLGGPVRAAA